MVLPVFSTKTVLVCVLPSTCCMLLLCHSPWCDGTSNILQEVQVMGLLIIQFFPVSCYCLPVMPRYLSQWRKLTRSLMPCIDFLNYITPCTPGFPNWSLSLTHLILFYVFASVIHSEVYKSWDSAVCIFPHSSFTVCLSSASCAGVIIGLLCVCWTVTHSFTQLCISQGVDEVLGGAKQRCWSCSVVQDVMAVGWISYQWNYLGSCINMVVKIKCH